MTTSLKLVYDANTDTPDKKGEINFDELFTPDPNFELQIQTPISQTFIQKQTSALEPFPELILDDFQIPDEVLPAEKEINHTQKMVKTQVDQKLRFPKVIVDEIPKEIVIDKKEVQYLSILEQKSVFYANRFQEILQMYPGDTLENIVKRYAKILLYMLEQFHIISEKKHQVKFMVSLKRVLGEFDFEMEAIDYRNGVLKRGYIHPDEEFKEELECLYTIYYDCYKIAQRELHKVQKALDKIEREKLHQHITNIENEVLPHFHPDAPNYDSRNFPKSGEKSDT